MIRATSALYAVIGDPVEHSLSPVLHNYMMTQFGLNAVYVAFHVPKSKLGDCINSFKMLGLSGINVTVPHKEKVCEYADDCSDEVKVLGAANTLKITKNKISAHVTDPYGFLESLGPDKERFVDAPVLILGAGGAARSVMFALGELGPDRILIFNRTRDKARQLANDAKKNYSLDVKIIKQTELSAAVNESRIIVNTTSVGMSPHVNDSPLPDFSALSQRHYVYDLIYNPGKTRLLLEAENRGATIKNGLDMLIFQGLQSLRIWMDGDFSLNETQLKELRALLRSELGH